MRKTLCEVAFWFLTVAVIVLIAEYIIGTSEVGAWGPYLLWMLGLLFTVSGSIFGASFGIYTTGVSIIGGGVQAPRIQHRNLITIIFCEAVAIYGLITGLFIVDNHVHINSDNTAMNWFNSFILFGSGVTSGLVNLFGGIATGVIGSGTALADAAVSSTFVKNIITEIFASVIGLYGLIVGVYVTSRIQTQ